MESEYVWVYLLVYLAVLFFQKKIKINDDTTSSLPTCPLRREFYKRSVLYVLREKVLVDLRCDNSLMKTMVDRFGEDVTTLAYDMTSFRVQTEVSASPTFFGWVFGFNGKVQILAPESVKEQYRQMIAQADEGMQEKENKGQEI